MCQYYHNIRRWMPYILTGNLYVISNSILNRMKLIHKNLKSY
jgi:hypothetical protein